MKFKLIIIVALAVLIISIGTVSADENTTHDETLKLDSTPGEIQGIDTNDTVSIGEEATFTDLQNTINSAAPEDNITLEEDYVYNTGFSTGGISITKSLTIDGNGHTIDTDSQSRAFTIAADNVVLKNLQIIGSGNAGAVTITGSNVVIDNVTFNTSHSTGNGGAVYSTGANTGIYYSTFIACVSANGGALYLGGSSTVSKSKFINCTASNSAGAIYINALCNVSNCIFDHNSALNGGDVYVAASECGLIVSNFTGSHADAKGGAVFIGNAGFNIIDCQFTSCGAYEDGGAVHMSNGSSGSVMTCTFTECTADGDGGAVHFMGEECEISDTIFTECTAEYGDGGAVYANGKANATGSVFTNNVADNLGGAIYNCMYSESVFDSNTDPEIYFDEEFRENLTMTIDVSGDSFGEDIIVLVHVKPSVSLNATAVISDTIKVFEIVNGTGILNISGLNAGAYVLTVTVNSTMEYNSCSNSTMFSVMKVPPVIEIIANDIYYGDNATISINMPDDATGMVELYVNGAVINFTINDEGKPSTIIPGLEAGTYYVTASYTGDLNYNDCSNTTTFKVMHNTFSQLQKIIDDDTTGEITLDRDYYGEGSEITISKTITINGNGHTLDAKGQSRIFNVQSGTVVLDNLSLVNGNSDSYGGAAYFQSGSTCTVRNCNFTGNTAKDEGGAVYFYEPGTVTNSTFTANSAKKGGAIYSNGNTDTVNSTFIDNSADLGGAIYNCDHEICTFTGNSQPDFYFDEQYRKNVTMTVNAEEIMMGEDLTVIIIFNQDITGNVTVNIDGVDMDVPIVNRTGNLLVHGLSAGHHNLTASFNGNFEYRQCNVMIDVTVLKKKVSVIIETVNIQFGDVETVNVQLNESIEGIATVEITKRGSYLANGTVMGNNFSMNYTITLINGSASLSIPDLTVGEYTATVHYPGDGNYTEANATINFTVSKRDLNVLVDFSNEDKTITFTPQANVAYVSVEIAGNIYEIEANVSTTIYLNDLASGNYTYIITYPGDDAYNPYTSSANITISRLPVNVTVNAGNITYGQTQNVTAIVPDGATSMVNFILSRDEQIIANTTSQVVNGMASYEIPQLNAGTYLLRASYLGDSKYEASSFYEKRFKVDPNIDVSPKVKIGDDGKIVIEVGDITGRISVFVDDAEDGSRPINNKKFTYYLVTEDYSVGYHNLTFEYIGSDLDENVFKKWDSTAQKYMPVKYLINITQRPTETVLDSDSDQKFVLVLEDDDGTLLSNATGNVTFTILDEYANVVAEEVVGVVNGIATLDISKYKNGNYVIQWSYSGDEKHTPIARQVSLSIIHKASRINAGDVKIIYTQSRWYSVTIYGNDGKPLANAAVEFLIGNRLISKVNTNANGVAGVSISSNPGTYSLSIKAPGKTVTKKLTVEHIISLKTVKIKRSAKKLVLTATLKKVNGKYLKGKKITFKFNGKKYSAKTNKKGVAKVTIKKNVLKKIKKGKKVTYQATYLKDTVKKKSKVKK